MAVARVEEVAQDDLLVEAQSLELAHGGVLCKLDKLHTFGWNINNNADY